MRRLLTILATAAVALAAFGAANASAAGDQPLEPCLNSPFDRMHYLAWDLQSIGSADVDYWAASRECRELIVDVQINAETSVHVPWGFQDAFSIVASGPIDPQRCSAYRESTRVYYDRHGAQRYEHLGTVARRGVRPSRDGRTCELAPVGFSNAYPSVIPGPGESFTGTAIYRVVTSAWYESNSWLGRLYTPRTVRAAYVPAM